MKIKTGCDICNTNGAISYFGYNTQPSGLKTVGYLCSICGSEYGDSLTTYINKLLYLDYIKNPTTTQINNTVQKGDICASK